MGIEVLDLGVNVSYKPTLSRDNGPLWWKKQVDFSPTPVYTNSIYYNANKESYCAALTQVESRDKTTDKELNSKDNNDSWALKSS